MHPAARTSSGSARRANRMTMGGPRSGTPHAADAESGAGRQRRPVRLAAILLATVWVTAAAPARADSVVRVHDTPGLVAAVQQADSGGPSTIQLAVGVYAPTATLTLTRDVTIRGPSGPGEQLSGSALPEGTDLFDVAGDSTATFVGVALDLVGYENQGSAINVEPSGVADIENSTISGTGGPSLLVEDGGSATATNSSFSHGLEEGIVDQGTVSLTNVTVSGNLGMGIDDSGGSLALVNSIVAGNHPDCARAADSADVSLDDDGSCGVGALARTSPQLGQWMWNGGPTDSQLPQAGSPAIGVGDPAHCPSVDQRFAPRPSGRCDLGAVQAGASPPAAPSTTVPTSGAPTSAPTTPGTPTPTSSGSAGAVSGPTAGAVVGVVGAGTLHGAGGHAIAFSVNARRGGARGTLTYRDAGARVSLRAAKVSSVSVSPARGTVTLIGVARNLVGGRLVRFTVTVSVSGRVRTLRLRLAAGYDGGGRLWRGALTETRGAAAAG